MVPKAQRSTFLEITHKLALLPTQMAYQGLLITDPSVIEQQPGNAAATIADDTVLEVNTPDSGMVTFAGSTGTLWLDQPETFAGSVVGFGAQDRIDLAQIGFGAQTRLAFRRTATRPAAR